MSTGRGGAGNFGKEPSDSSLPTPNDLRTPAIKSDMYTTGRGGTGNMAKNDPNNPQLARQSQDVEGPAPREPEGSFHYGRGGAANVGRSSAEVEAGRNGHAGAAAGANAGVVDEVKEKGRGILEKLAPKK